MKLLTTAFATSVGRAFTQLFIRRSWKKQRLTSWLLMLKSRLSTNISSFVLENIQDRATVTMAVSLAVYEIFSVKEWRDLENWIRSCSRSLKVAPFDRPYDFLLVRHCKINIITQGHSNLYHSKGWVRFPIRLPLSIMGLSCIISEKKRDIGRKSWFFSYSLAFDAPFGIKKKTRMVALPDVKKFWGYVQRCQQNTGMWQTDRRTDRQTDKQTDRQ